MGIASASLRSTVRSKLGVGRFRVYAEPERTILFPPGTAGWNQYIGRFDAAASRMFVLEPNAVGDNPSNSLEAVQNAFSSATTEQRTRAILCNAEYPWLEILYHADGSAPNSSWRTTWVDTVEHEFARMGLGVPGPGTTTAEWKRAAIQSWRDMSSWLVAQGVQRHWHYGSPGPANWQEGNTGFPRAGMRGNPASGVDWFWHGNGSLPGLRAQADAGVAAGTQWALAKAQGLASGHGVSCYQFGPNWSRIDARFPHFGGGFAERRLAGSNTAASPPFTVATYRHWARMTTASVIAEYRRSLMLSRGQGNAFATVTDGELGARIAAIVFPGGAETYQRGNYVARNKWWIPGSKDPVRFAEDCVTPFFRGGDANTPLVGWPDELIFWDAPNYFWIATPLLYSAAGPHVAAARVAWEQIAFGRPYDPVAEGVGVSDFASIDAYNAANNMGDARWRPENHALPMWTPGGGSQLPAPCVFDSSSVLWNLVDRSATVTMDHCVTAAKHWLSDRNVSILEATRQAIDAVWR